MYHILVREVPRSSESNLICVWKNQYLGFSKDVFSVHVNISVQIHSYAHVCSRTRFGSTSTHLQGLVGVHFIPVGDFAGSMTLQNKTDNHNLLFRRTAQTHQNFALLVICEENPSSPPTGRLWFSNEHMAFISAHLTFPPFFTASLMAVMVPGMMPASWPTRSAKMRFLKKNIVQYW